MEYTLEQATVLINAALAVGSKPDLEPERLQAVMLLAESVNADGDVTYTSESMARAVAAGWRWKAGIISNQYELGGGSGKYLKRNQWFEQCTAIADKYSNGVWMVDGSSPVNEDTTEDVGDPFTLVMPFLVRGDR